MSWGSRGKGLVFQAHNKMTLPQQRGGAVERVDGEPGHTPGKDRHSL